MDRPVIIVGSGHAGARAAETLRKGGWDGTITVIGAEGIPPYERPAVSKAMLFGANGRPRYLWPTDAPSSGIEMIAARVAAIDRAARQVVLANGRRLGYEHLVLATGARPREVAGIGATSDRIFYLRTAQDAERLRPRLAPGSRLLVVGAGLIGLEVAAGAATAGLEVTVVEMAPRALGRAVPDVVAAEVAALHRARGVHLRFGVNLQGVHADGEKITATFGDNGTQSFDVALMAGGVLPRTELAESAGLAIDNGIVTDAHLATSDPHVFAAGDVASFLHPLFGVRLRLESQQNGDDQGRYVARRILGETSPFSATPWFWSDQFDRVLQVAGVPGLGARAVERPIEGGRATFHLDPDGRLLGAAAFGPQASVAREIGAARRLIAQGATLTAELAANPAVDLREALRPLASHLARVL